MRCKRKENERREVTGRGRRQEKMCRGEKERRTGADVKREGGAGEKMKGKRGHNASD